MSGAASRWPAPVVGVGRTKLGRHEGEDPARGLDPSFGLADPASLRRWSAESELIRVNQDDHRVERQHRLIWLFVMGFLVLDIVIATWFILARF